MPRFTFTLSLLVLFLSQPSASIRARPPASWLFSAVPRYNLLELEIPPGRAPRPLNKETFYPRARVAGVRVRAREAPIGRRGVCG